MILDWRNLHGKWSFWRASLFKVLANGIKMNAEGPSASLLTGFTSLEPRCPSGEWKHAEADSCTWLQPDHPQVWPWELEVGIFPHFCWPETTIVRSEWMRCPWFDCFLWRLYLCFLDVELVEITIEEIDPNYFSSFVPSPLSGRLTTYVGIQPLAERGLKIESVASQVSPFFSSKNSFFVII